MVTALIVGMVKKIRKNFATRVNLTPTLTHSNLTVMPAVVAWLPIAETVIHPTAKPVMMEKVIPTSIQDLRKCAEPIVPTMPLVAETVTGNLLKVRSVMMVMPIQMSGR